MTTTTAAAARADGVWKVFGGGEAVLDTMKRLDAGQGS
jgi:hypothetical protein